MPGLGRGRAAQTRLMPPSWRWTRTQCCSVWVAAYRWHSRRQAVGVRTRPRHDVDAAEPATAAGSCGCSATAALTVAPAVAVASVEASTAPDTAVESSLAPRRSWRWCAACVAARAGGGGRTLRRLYSTRDSAAGGTGRFAGLQETQTMRNTIIDIHSIYSIYRCIADIVPSRSRVRRINKGAEGIAPPWRRLS